MNAIWRYLINRDTSMGGLWLAVASGVLAGHGSVVGFLAFLVAAVAFDLLTKGQSKSQDPQ